MLFRIALYHDHGSGLDPQVQLEITNFLDVGSFAAVIEFCFVLLFFMRMFFVPSADALGITMMSS